MQHINGGDGPPLLLELVPQEWVDQVSRLEAVAVSFSPCSPCRSSFGVWARTRRAQG